MATKKEKMKEIGETHRNMTTIDDEEVDEKAIKVAFMTAEKGTILRKVQFNYLRSPIMVRLSLDHTFLVYKHARGRPFCLGGGGKEKQVPVSMLIDVRSGWNTDKFMKAAVKEDFNTIIPESCCFSIIFRKLHNLQKTVDFVTESPEEQKIWLIALRQLLNDIRAASLHFNEKTWLQKNFQKADVNNNGKLSFVELWELLKKLSVQITQKECKRQFLLSDINKTDDLDVPALNFDEFVMFFRSLTRRPELKKVMRSYSDLGIDLWSPTDLKKFLEISQGSAEVTLEECKAIIQEHEPDDETRKEGNLSVHGFRLLLLSKWGALMKPLHSTTVFQDMTQPLCEYFIHSTHNTYLLGHQFRGDATIEGYIRALKCGARMLELDIWEGDHEPVVTHGYTLVHPNTLINVVRAIDQYAFRASPYPLTLSLENHCGLEFQIKMAHIFMKIFGDKIYVPSSSLKVLPSPEELKNRILLKCKKLADPKESKPINEEDEVFNDVYDAIFDESFTAEEVIAGPTITTMKVGDVLLPNIQPSAPEIQAKKKEKVPIAQELSDLIALKASKLRDLRRDVDEHPWNSHTSVVESKAKELALKEYENVVYYTSRHLMKIYPSGKRLDSTNVQPMHFWIIGVQNVTMNAQTASEEMDLNNGFFSINNSCGYILKPKWMREGVTMNYSDLMKRDSRMTLRVQVISAQNLPRPDTKLTDSVVDPYVTLEIFGFPFDGQKYRTGVVKANGFNPVWNSDQFVIKLKAPEVALLRFCVKDYDRISANDFIGQYTIPIMSVTQGYAHIPLLTGTDHTGDPSAALFVHVEIDCAISEEELTSSK